MKFNKVPHRAIVLGGLLLAYACQSPPQQKATVTTTPTAPAQFLEHIRTTPFQTPEQELQGFQLPEGFEITLFASEPLIGKPMNMAFDVHGRLWVTQSFEYPLAATSDFKKDRITILEDTNNDGKADKAIPFETGLNIPIGIWPVSDGAIAFSIPNIYHFKDRDGDGKADEQKKLLGPFGYQDTHGMVNNLIRGFDGWIHASHGFSNTSTFAGADGDSLHLFSGNTFRFKLDGSRAEQTTFGRVNPFGFAYDERGFLYSVDCHSKPIYQLIPGADYPHFGKTPTGIGFAPEMTPYELGSTALSGLVNYTGTQFPEKYRNNFFIGDVVTSKISRNSVSYEGSTPKAKFEEDFLVSNDPWFRPVDIKVGPDGALYVADFYNRIIGHYEVSLDHPGRDRVSGRIWKITYKGGNKDTVKPAKSIAGLIKQLQTPQLTTRMLLTDHLFDTFGKQAIPAIDKALLHASTTPEQLVQLLWLSHRLEHLSDATIKRFLAHPNIRVRTHLTRIVGEQKKLTTAQIQQLTTLLDDPSAFVQRAATEALYQHTSLEALPALMRLYSTIPNSDNHLQHSCLLTIRRTIEKHSFEKAIRFARNDQERALLVRASIDLPQPAIAKSVFELLQANKVATGDRISYASYAARYLPNDSVDALLQSIQSQKNSATNDLILFYQALSKGMAQSGRPLTNALLAAAQQSAVQVLQLHADKPLPSLHQLSPADMQLYVQAIQMVQTYGIQEAEPYLLKVLPDGSPFDLQWNAVNALQAISMTKHVDTFRQLFEDGKTYPIYKEVLADALGKTPTASVLTSLRRGLQPAGPALQLRIARALANSQEGIQQLLAAMQASEISSTLLQEANLKSLIDLNGTVAQKATLKNALAAAPNLQEEKDKVIKQRLTTFQTRTGNLKKGREVFVSTCAPCHQIKGNGGLIGPQLDGIGNWGAAMLAEKILDPNRNVTEAFKPYTIQLTNNEVKTGLYRRTEGESIVFADMSGQEFTLPKSTIKEQTVSHTTIMPDQFQHTIPENDFYELLHYLTSIK